MKQQLHTYIIGHYNPSVRIIDLVSHTTYVVLILYIIGGTYCLKSTPNDRFFEKLFHDRFYLLSEFLPEICWEEIAEEILGFSSNKPTHYLLDHGATATKTVNIDKWIKSFESFIKIISIFLNLWN